VKPVQKPLVPAALVTVLLAAGGGFLFLQRMRAPRPSRVQRGYEIAQEKGCFACHGPGGIRGMANPGYGLDEVPPFAGGLVTMYAQNEAELREWILDGSPKRVRDDPEQWKLRERAIIQMPAWRGLLAEEETEALVAYVKAVSDLETPKDDQADAGRRTAQRLGCFNCHGPQGRGSHPNPQAFKGYIPSWDGPDFTELAKDDAEVREWILYGRPRRLQDQKAARYFLDRQPIKMPPYQGHVSEAEVGELLAYIRWVRAHPY
jgi:mono/diheme cytochrome c family protein